MKETKTDSKHFFKQKRTDFSPQTPVSYFSISLKRLVFLSWVSGGLYQLYWAYQNWKAVKKATHAAITPILRSWFCALFWMYPLFCRIRRSGKSQGVVSKFFFICTGTYIILLFSNVFVLNRPYADERILNTLILAVSFTCVFGFHLLTSLLLIPVQRTINDYRKALDPTHQPLKKITRGEILTVAAGALIFYGTLGYVIQKQPDMPLSWEESNQTHFVIQTTYYNTLGYQTYCTRQGWTLQKYPDLFLEKIRTDLSVLEKKLSDRKIDLAALINTYIQTNQKSIQMKIDAELNDLRKELILEGIAQSGETPSSRPVWDDKWDRLISPKEVCQLIDAEAETLIRENEPLFRDIHRYVTQIKP